jgi:sulfide:quinone oxidoreductase
MIDAHDSTSDSGLQVLIAGGGVAALEAAFALHALAGDRVRTRILSPSDAYVDRPRTIGEPFNHGHAEHFPLAPLVARAGAELVPGVLVEVDPTQRTALTSDGEQHSYDALVVAAGATMQPRFAHATTIDDARMDEVLHGLVMDIEGGYVQRLAVVVPAPVAWPLPAYEVALMAAERAWDMQAEMEVVLLTPERSPLEMFGEQASLQISELLAERGVEVVTSAVSDVTTNRTIVAHPSGRVVDADRIVAMPELRGPDIGGLPSDGGGFLPVDRFGRVRGVERVWAAGDVTDYPIKQGGVAAGLADLVARGIAAVAGVDLTIEPFAPALRAVLMTGGKPRYLYGQAAPWPIAEGRSQLSDHPLDGSEDKILADYLTQHLHELRAAGVGAQR